MTDEYSNMWDEDERFRPFWVHDFPPAQTEQNPPEDDDGPFEPDDDDADDEYAGWDIRDHFQPDIRCGYCGAPEGHCRVTCSRGV